MSPPTKPIHQEGTLANIADLDGAIDGAITSKNGTSKLESPANVCHKVVQGAVEHEDIVYSANKQPISQVENQKEVGKCDEKPCEETNDHFELQLVSLPDRTPDCLGSSGSCDSSDDGLIGNLRASLDEVELRRSNSRTTLSRKRRKMRISSKKTAKKRKTLDFRQNSCCKAAGGGHQTNQTCTSGNGKSGMTSAPTQTGLAGTAFCNQGCRGGGGGDGGDSGDGPGENKKVIGHDSPFKAVIPKKKKSSSDEMEVDGDLPSSSDSPMDIDTRSTGKMDHSPQVTKPEEKLPKPDEEPPRKDDPVVTEELLISWHLRINHHTFCNKDHCQRCHWVRALLKFHMDENKRGCTCRNCNLRTKILQFHHPKCKIPDCRVCATSKQTDKVSAVRNQPAPQNVGRAVLNITTAMTSLDTDEAVVYCNDTAKGVCQFREHEDYTFKQSERVGKGGHGEVHDICVVNAKLKDDHFSFANSDLVAKKGNVSDDELCIYKCIETHPNFVQTYLIVNRKDGKYNHLTVMEKCDKSLGTYLKEVHKSGKALNLYEAMHFWTQVLDAVAHFHTQRIPIIHKDIKADNVLLTFETNLIRAKLADFDAVKLLHNDYTQPGLQPKGTPNFIAPEVLKMDVHGRPADIYSMGIFLLELLFGAKIKNGQWRNPKPSPLVLDALEELRKMDPDLGELIKCCLKGNDKERPTAVQIRESRVVRKYLEREVS